MSGKSKPANTAQMQTLALTLTLRLPMDLVAQVDEVTERLCPPGEKPNRSYAIRKLLRLGLIAFAEQGADGPRVEPDQDGEDEGADE